MLKRDDQNKHQNIIFDKEDAFETLGIINT